MFWLGAIVAIGLLIVVHEAGHYVVARLCGMRVDRFSIGFGPGLLKRKRGETEFQIAPIPFGGYVQIAGMNPAEEVDRDDPRSFPNRPVLQRFATIFAGPATNYLFAIVLAFGLFAVAGIHGNTSYYEVATVSTHFNAYGKLEAGDEIVAINGKRIYLKKDGQTYSDLPKLVDKSKGKPIAITVLRGGQQVHVTVTPKIDKEHKKADGSPRYRLGIQYREQRYHVGVIDAAGHALAYPVVQTKMIVGDLYAIVTGKEKGNFAGPVGITRVIAQAIEAGWIYLVQLLMVLNVYLGLFNLLPLPALDGGRLVFLGYEMITRRRANPKVEATVHMVGIMVLLLLMVLVTYHDIVNL